ncbi:protein branchless trichome [Phtheirospermum japonicum]|uniref:Protein branchless trichome n=1 Tax=Phtheirospermum japonicum TaxID=374723 RepID=A0A830C1J4_9LAMI|nr:protein branchless trichome [Phtheirospermum japonicum]
MKIRSHEITTNNSNNNNNLNFPITNPTWKLYENPFYISHHHKPPPQQIIHKLHLPVSSRKIASSFWDLTFIKPFITELKAELDRQRKARKKTESLNKRLSKELSEERKGKEALERVCEELAKEISADKSEINRMKREIEEERKMLRTAEIIREERVQMKLAEARMVLEEKLSELEITRKKENISSSNARGGDLEAENPNPHIRRGIKGFVEFPRVVRAIGCSTSGGKHFGSKLECQKAQLNMLLKQKGTVRFNGLIAS